MYKNKRLTIDQVSEMYGYSVNTLKTSFQRTAAAIKKKYGVIITKCRDVDGVYYTIETPRALTIYEEIKDRFYVPLQTLKMNELASFIVVGVAATPQGVFRGKAKQFLDYIGISHNKKNVKLFEQAIAAFMAEGKNSYIGCEKDKESYIIYLRDDFQKPLSTTIEMLRSCKKAITESKKQDVKVIELWRVWQAYRVCYQQEINPVSDRQLSQITGLTPYKIGKNRDLLRQYCSDWIIFWKQYDQRLDGKRYCLGRGVDLNILKDSDEIMTNVQL